MVEWNPPETLRFILARPASAPVPQEPPELPGAQSVQVCASGAFTFTR